MTDLAKKQRALIAELLADKAGLVATIKDQAGEIARLREQLQTRADTVLKL